MDTNLDIYEPYELAGSSLTYLPSNLDQNNVNERESLIECDCEKRSECDVECKIFQFGSESEIECDCEKRSECDVECKIFQFGNESQIECDCEERSECDDECKIFQSCGEEEEVTNQVEEDECSCSSLLDWFSNCSTSSQHLKHNTGWTRFGVEADPWADDKQQVVQVLDEKDFILTIDEEEGILSDRMVLAGSSFLDKNPESNNFTLAKLVLQEKRLVDVTILGAHRYLQYIDLSRNSLTDLSALSNVPYLMHLDVSHNQLTSVLQFEAPWNLTYVNYSYNNVKYIDDLSDFWSIVQLDLSFNEIVQIEGLENLRYLNDLNLSNNEIEKFENLNNLHIEYLNISHNRISLFEEGPDVGMKTMLNLSCIDISFNCLTTLAIFQGVYHVIMCRACNNYITELLEVEHMKSMRKLTDLDFSNNGITQWPRYRDVMIYSIPSLCYLDDSMVETKEKIAATFLIEPDTSLRAAFNRSHLVLLEGLNEPSLDLDILPIDQGIYPLVILVGPPGSQKAKLLDSLIQNLEPKVCRGVNHISRAKESFEVDGVDYHFVTQEKFNELTRKGTFLCIGESFGNSCGFSRAELAKSVKEGKLCITHMNLLEALTLKARGLEPHLVMTISESETLHLERLQDQYIATTYSVVTPLAEEMDSGAVSNHRRPDEHETADYDTASFDINDSVINSASSQETNARVGMENYFTESIEKASSINNSFAKNFSEGTSEVQTSEKEMHITVIESDVSFPYKNYWEQQPLGIPQTNWTDSIKKLLDVTERNGNGEHQFRRNESSNWEEPLYEERAMRHGVSFADECQTSPKESFIEPYDNNSITSPVESETFDIVNQVESYQSEVTFSSYGSDVIASPKKGDVMPRKIGSGFSINKDSADVSESMSTPSRTTSQTQHQVASGLTAVIQNYISSILKTRASYFKIHHENPGLFSETVYTDNLEEAFEKLQQIVKDTYVSRPKQYPMFNLQDNPAYTTMISNRLEKIKEDIYSDHSIMEKQMEEMQKYKLPRIPPLKRGSVLMRDAKNYATGVQKEKCRKC